MRYPVGMAPGWFPDLVEIHSDPDRNLHGEVVSSEAVVVRAKIRRTSVELIEAGGRTSRQGATIQLAARPGVAIKTGATFLRDARSGEIWSVIGVIARNDYQGNVHFYTCDCVTKASEVVS